MLLYLSAGWLATPWSVPVRTLLAISCPGVAVPVTAAVCSGSFAQSRTRCAGEVNDGLLDSGLPKRAAAAARATPNLFIPIY